jgi:predicted phage-related endonuclease
MEELKELGKIQKDINKLYARKKDLEKKVIDKMVENKENGTKYAENEVYTLVWVFDKKIDYEKMKSMYPDVYMLGLQTSFSATKALKSMDSRLFNAILRDCTTVEPHYELKKEKSK